MLLGSSRKSGPTASNLKKKFLSLTESDNVSIAEFLHLYRGRGFANFVPAAHISYFSTHNRFLIHTVTSAYYYVIEFNHNIIFNEMSRSR